MHRPSARATSVLAGLLLGGLAMLAGCAPAEPVAAQTPAPAPAVPAALPPAAEAPAEVRLANTAVHELVADGSERRYPVWVDVPASYADEPHRQYPVVFVTYALYAFPLVRSIRNLLGQRGRNIEDFILVGLPPEHGLTSKQSRSRDYTPSDPRADPRRRGDDYTAEAYGEAAAYRDFIERQVFPLIASRYRADMGRKVFAGHSYGGLFGSYVLLTRPTMFRTYILGSPSLWFDQGRIRRIEAEYARTHRDLPAQVLLYAGMYETTRPGPRYYRSVDLVGDMHAFAERLRRRGYPGLRVEAAVIADEDHFTVFPALISRGLVRALPGRGPYLSG